jgi:MiaB-like tRNA modifying enzyme
MNIYIETYGCSSNQSDSEIMAGLLARAGLNITQNIELADVVIVNTCIVKTPTEQKILHRIKELQQKYPEKKLIIAGCMPKAEYALLREIAPKASFIGPRSVTKIATVVKKTLEKGMVEEFSETEKILQPKIRKNPAIEIIQIAEGCLGDCAFCITKHARGKLQSYTEEKILQELSSSKAGGCKEFWLTSQDCGCYGFDKETNIAALLEKITRQVKGKYYIRVGMLNPIHLKKLYPRLIEAYKHENVFKFLHLPVQSGSDKVLERMNRGYKVKDFIAIVNAFRKEIPDLQLWTDIIVGFPSETEEDFLSSVDLIKQIQPDFVNVSKYGARPGTLAAKMQQIDYDAVKERSTKISAIVDEIAVAQNKKWLGWSGPAIVDEFNTEKQSWIARNFAYKPIVLKERCRLGEIFDVKITSTGRVLQGKINV